MSTITNQSPNFFQAAGQQLRRLRNSLASGLITGAVVATAVMVPVLTGAQAPGPKVSLESQVSGQTNQWATSNSAAAGQTLRYVVSYQNTGNSEQKQVRVKLTPAEVLSVSDGSARLYSTLNSSGQPVQGDVKSADGVNIGDYGPGANAYLTFEAKVPAAEQLACGDNRLRTTTTVKAEGGSESTAEATTTVKRDCPAANPAQPQPTFSCDTLTVTKATDGSRRITAKVDYTAKDGAQLKTVSYDFGDGSQPLVTDKTQVDYTYLKDDNFTVTARLTVSANGKDQQVTTPNCAKPVSFAPVTSGPTTPTQPTDPANGQPLPKSGPADVLAIFAGASVAGGLGHWLVRRYYLSRQG